MMKDQTKQYSNILNLITIYIMFFIDFKSISYRATVFYILIHLNIFFILHLHITQWNISSTHSFIIHLQPIWINQRIWNKLKQEIAHINQITFFIIQTKSLHSFTSHTMAFICNCTIPTLSTFYQFSSSLWLINQREIQHYHGLPPSDFLTFLIILFQYSKIYLNITTSSKCFIKVNWGNFARFETLVLSKKT